MNKLYSEFFYVPKYGKVREKVMLARTTLSVVIIVICLASMAITAYAFFSHSIYSGSNIMQAASFETKVSIQFNSPASESVPIEQSDKSTQSATLYAGHTYIVTIEKAGTATTGFCIISADGIGNIEYHTQQIGKYMYSDIEEKNSITFTLTVTNTTTVTFISQWGTSSRYAHFVNDGINDELYIWDGEAVNLQIMEESATEGNESANKSSDESTPAETTPQGANPETTESETTSETTQPEIIHIVVSGENLTIIANMYDTSFARIIAYNGISDPNYIVSGQQIKIPPTDWIMPGNTIG